MASRALVLSPAALEGLVVWEGVWEAWASYRLSLLWAHSVPGVGVGVLRRDEGPAAPCESHRGFCPGEETGPGSAPGWQQHGGTLRAQLGCASSHIGFLPFSLEVNLGLFSQNQGQLPKRAECLQKGGRGGAFEPPLCWAWSEE